MKCRKYMRYILSKQNYLKNPKNVVTIKLVTFANIIEHRHSPKKNFYSVTKARLYFNKTQFLFTIHLIHITKK